MKRALIILAMAGTALAGYYGREWQDAIDRNAANPIGPYETRWHSDWVEKAHSRTGRIWVASKDTDWQWKEVVGPRRFLFFGKN